MITTILHVCRARLLHLQVSSDLGLRLNRVQALLVVVSKLAAHSKTLSHCHMRHTKLLNGRRVVLLSLHRGLSREIVVLRPGRHHLILSRVRRASHWVLEGLRLVILVGHGGVASGWLGPILLVTHVLRLVQVRISSCLLFLKHILRNTSVLPVSAGSVHFVERWWLDHEAPGSPLADRASMLRVVNDGRTENAHITAEARWWVVNSELVLGVWCLLLASSMIYYASVDKVLPSALESIRRVTNSIFAFDAAPLRIVWLYLLSPVVD